jgi:phage protein D
MQQAWSMLRQPLVALRHPRQLLETSHIFSRLRRAGVPIVFGHSIVRADGEAAVQRATVAAIHLDGTIDHHRTQVFDCDRMGLCHGFLASSELARQAGAETHWKDHAGGWLARHTEWFESSIENLFVAGEITGVELESHAGEELFIVRGHDRGHRLLRGRKTRSFTQVKVSDIARQVAQEAGLFSRVEDTQVMLEYVLQHNQTDWEVLQQHAWDLGFEVQVEDKTLVFRPHQNDGPEALTLRREAQDLLDLRLRLSTVGLVGEMVVQGWSPKDKAVIVGRASAGELRNLMGGTQDGLEAASGAFGPAAGILVDRPVSSQAEADQIAQGRLKEMALAYVTGEGVSIGRADLEAGTVVRIDGFGDRFSGLYYLASVSHTYLPGRGYRTAFTVRRNAA